MKPISVSSVITFILSFFLSLTTQAQTFGISSSAVWVTDCNQSNYFNTSGAGPTLIGPAANTFTNLNFGTHTQNSGTLILRGGEVRSFKTPGVSNVCAAHMYYRVYLQSGAPGSFNQIDLDFIDDCNVPMGQYPSGGTCVAGNQKWNRVTPNGATTPYAPVNLTTLAAGNYVLEVYYDVTGSSASTTLCDETAALNNSGNNYKAFFSIQAPDLTSVNPTTCNGSQGYITVTGLTPGVTYALTYTDDGVFVGPANYTATAAGEITISGLNAGIYSDFQLDANGCSTNLNTGLILSNPVITPTFNPIPPFCAGTTAPILPTTSLNGITGTWNPATVSNTASGTYIFTPTAGQCGLPVVKSITVKANITPTFTFGTSITVCSGGIVPSLPTTSSNGYSGTWSPAVVSNTVPGTYTFTPAAGQCATTASLSVTINPNITPTFSFGTTLTICAGAGVPALPASSTNGINGTWNPAVVDNNASGTYTFTPTAGQCATTASFNVTVNPNATPTFAIGTSVAICQGGSVPTLPTTSTNGINGTWSPATIDNQNSATYTFTPAAGICALPVTFNVTVNSNILPTFAFGTAMTICAGSGVPSLSTTSSNGIAGTWNPATISNGASGTYTFTPTAGQCATTATFTVTVNPNIAPVFSFGSTLTICAGQPVPVLPMTSNNGITGTWSPAVVDNNASGVYTFTPDAGVCATPTSFNVTVNPNATPVFSFGSSLNICAGGSVPSLPTTSTNGVNGTWSPAVVDNQNSGNYTFTPAAGVCALPVVFNVSVNPNITPTFTYGTSLTICAGGSVPALVTTSGNGINGTWSPATVNNGASGTYTFTPAAGQCALPATFNVTVNPNITPSFSFGTSISMCNGATAPVLPANSTNGVSGTWSPAAIDNTTSGTYTFTPDAGQCAVTATLNVTVNPNLVPSFAFGTSLTICAGSSAPALPGNSSNGIAGAWSPSTIDNQNSATYMFTPAAGQCATSATFTVTVTPNTVPTFTYGSSLTICDGSAVPTLDNASVNGINGTWSPATVDNHSSAVYTFTPAAGQCATPATFTVTVNPILTPTFTFGTTLSICVGGTVPSLPNNSTNGISGTWSPAAIDNQNSGVYTFTPAAGQCATSTTFTVNVNSNTPPVFAFGSTLTICAGSGVPSLATTSGNGIAGTWSPSAVDNQNSGVYTFTPAPGQCATSATFTVTVNPIITPNFTFGTSLTICNGGTVPALPNTSVNGVAGTWSPAVVDNTTSGTYTFTPSGGQCTLSVTFSVTVNPIVTPAFSFGTTLTICAGSGVPTLATTSTNGITGTWSPAAVDNQNSGTYTFTPAAGQCATSTTYTVTVNPNATPTFSFGPSLTICAGSTVPSLPSASDNGINGSWSPAVVDDQHSGTYTFTPAAGICALPVVFNVTVNPNLTPSFTFGTSQTICDGSMAPVLSNSSTNGISGTWSPAIVDNHNSGTYTFTPDAGQCAVPTTLTVTVNPVVAPTFSFGSTLTICAGSAVPALSLTSDNGVPGTWSAPTVDNQNSGTYTFTPAAGQCATPVTFSVTVNQNTVPVFSFGTSLTICAGSAVPTLPGTSDNGINGSWSAASVDNQNSAVYTFTPVVMPGQCIIPTTFTVTVNPIVTPTFSLGSSVTLCAGGTAPVLPTTSGNGITGTWSPSVIDNQNSATYTFTTAAGQCAAPTATLNVTISPVATINTLSDTTVVDGAMVPAKVLSGTPIGANFNWANSNTAIGLVANGIDDVPSFVATNKGPGTIIGTVTVTPMINGCAGTARSYVITVKPLDKDVFVPNVFSPNGDGKNDLLYVYGSYIDKLDMHIFNQWGQQIEVITDKTRGWDGRFKGQPQPVGVYVYTLKAVMTDGRVINLKGNITLLR